MHIIGQSCPKNAQLNLLLFHLHHTDTDDLHHFAKLINDGKVSSVNHCRLNIPQDFELTQISAREQSVFIEKQFGDKIAQSLSKAPCVLKNYKPKEVNLGASFESMFTNYLQMFKFAATKGGAAQFEDKLLDHVKLEKLDFMNELHVLNSWLALVGPALARLIRLCEKASQQAYLHQKDSYP